MRTALQFILLLGWAVSAMPGQASAQNISADPTLGAFGSVEIGSSGTLDFAFTSLGPTPLTINGVNIEDDLLAAYFVMSIPTTVLLPGETLDLSVVFTPLVLGDHSAFLNVLSDAVPPDHDLSIPLQGTGVAALPLPEPPPLGILVFGLAVLGCLYWRHGLRNPEA